MGVLAVVIANFGISRELIGKKVSEQEMIRRLDQPVIDRGQLYGYKVFKIHSPSENSSDSPVYYIDIKDMLSPLIGSEHIVLENIEVSKELLPGLKPGECFFPE